MRRVAFVVMLCACGSQAPRPDPVVTAPPVDAAPPVVETLETRRAAFAALLDEQWQHALAAAPELASFYGEHRYDDRLTDMSLDAIHARLDDARGFLARFEAVDTTDFPEQEALSQQLMVRHLQDVLADEPFEPWLMPVTQLTGLHVDLVDLTSLLRFETVDDYEHYLARLQRVPALFEQLIALMRDGAAKGLVPAKPVIEATAKQVAAIGAAKAAASPFGQPVAAFPDTIPELDQDRLRAAILAAITDDVLPAYATLATFLADEYAPHGRDDPGVWALPDGDARYALLVQRNTTTALTPDEIHELGLAEVARIEGEERAIAKRLGFKSLAALHKHVRKDKKLYAKSRQDLLDRYQRHVDAMTEKLPELFGRLPVAKLEVLPTAAALEQTASLAEYFPGTPDGTRPGTVRVNTGDAKHRLWISAESSAYHEGVPGHHLQFALQQELPEMPPFRQFSIVMAFVEGWALYAERLAKEVGFYTDAYSDLGRLQNEIHRAIRLVVDTGLHAKRWTRAQVVQYFHDHSTIDEPTVQSETDRYIADPGQALAYKVGELTILRLRGEAEAARGDAFDVRAFHDLVLGAGSMPLDLLEQRFDAWLAAP